MVAVLVAVREEGGGGGGGGLHEEPKERLRGRLQLTDWLIERWTKGRLANLLNDVYTAGLRTECSLLNEVQQADWLTDFTKYHRLD